VKQFFQAKPTALFLSLVLLVVLTPGVIYKYQAAIPAFLEGWGLIWACLAAALCSILILTKNPFQIVQRFYCVPALLLIAMAGQYAFGIGWDFKNEYSVHMAHKLVSLAMLEGKLYFPYSAAFGVDNDYQVYNGAVFTNWAYGVPWLQMPFHLLSRIFSGGAAIAFFPDRIIFLIYYLISAFYAYFALNTYAGSRGYKNDAVRVLAITGILLCLYTTTVYVLASYRFLVYEETCAYFVLFQINAIASILLYRVTGETRYLYLLGINAGIATLIRPTGLAYDVVYALVLFERRHLQAIYKYALWCVPFIILFLASNYVKGGHFISLGLTNSNPGYDFHYAPTRFGSSCNGNPAGRLEVATSLLFNIFIAPKANTEHLQQCGFLIEYATSKLLPPFVGWGFSLLLLYYLYHVIKTQSVSLRAIAPLAGVVVMFLAYVNGGVGFEYRYAADFFPFYVLMAAELAVFYQQSFNRRWILGFTALACLITAFQFVTVVNPQLSTILKTASPADPAHRTGLWASMPLAYWNQYNAPNPPSTRSCSDRPLQFPHDKFGWSSTCDVADFVNLFLSLPAHDSAKRQYRLSFDLRGIMPDRIYLNGGYYSPAGDSVVFYANRGAMVSPLVILSFMWTDPAAAQKTKLYGISVQ
jgi:hypothetical protein